MCGGQPRQRGGRVHKLGAGAILPALAGPALVSGDQLDRVGKWFSRYGVWYLLFAWLPVIGDPLTFAAGIMKVDFRLFLGLVAIGKAGRYGVLVLAVQGVL